MVGDTKKNLEILGVFLAGQNIQPFTILGVLTKPIRGHSLLFHPHHCQTCWLVTLEGVKFKIFLCVFG